MLYTLTAVAETGKHTARIDAANDDDASIQAIAIIMKRAYGRLDSPWAIGQIDLRDELGDLVYRMPAKVDR